MYDIDLCLRLLAQGWEIVYSPHIVGHISECELERCLSDVGTEVSRLLQRHSRLIYADPYYSPWLSLRPEQVYEFWSAAERHEYLQQFAYQRFTDDQHSKQAA
jgi:hypothetical protein